MNFNKTKGNFLFLVILLLVNINYNLFAQNINELKEKKKKIEKEIESISTLIDKTENESKNSLTNVKLTKRKIELKNSLIKQIENETSDIQNQIIIRKEKIDSIKRRIEIIKDEYKRIIVYTQQNQIKTNLFILILASKDFNQAYKRLKFYQQLLEYKKFVAFNYKSSINKVKEENTILNENISQLNIKQNEKEKEIKRLKIDEENYNKKIDKLAKRKTDLLNDLNEQKRISNKLTETIKRLIEEEARKEAESNKRTKTTINYTLGNNFKENKGKFRLPVEDGIISQYYGESFHPILKEVKIKNNGIDISISKESIVYSIFKGEVRKVFKIPGANLAVIIRHGTFLTVYSNLTVVNVTAGQEINTFQKIGEINLQKGEETAILHFELWNENKTEDPLKWINI